MAPRPSSRSAARWHWLIPAAVVTYLLVAYTVVWFVDVRQVFNATDRLQEAGLQPPLMWVQLFMQGGLTELIQWSLLGSIIILAARLGGSYGARSAGCPPDHWIRRRARFWTLIAVTVTLVLIEDAGNPRHLIRHYADVIGGSDSAGSRPVETLYLAVIVGIGLFAFLRYGRDLLAIPRVQLPAILGVGFYAIAIAMNAVRGVGEFYVTLGGWLVDDLLRAPQIVDSIPVPFLAVHELDLRFFFVDFVVEESLEVMGAAFLLVAVLAYRAAMQRPDAADSVSTPADASVPDAEETPARR